MKTKVITWKRRKREEKKKKTRKRECLSFFMNEKNVTSNITAAAAYKRVWRHGDF